MAVSPAAADDPYDVPDSATITITGDGSGHGKGLSQYGAYGAANQGLKVGEILDFYYPGTTAGQSGGKVAVWISGDDDKDLVVDDQSGLTLKSLATRTSFKLNEPRATGWRLQPSGGKTVVAFRTASWHTFKTLRGDAEVAAGGAPIGLRTPDGRVSYRGALRSTHHDGDRVTVNVLPMEKYVRGVVPAELSSIWPQQAMRAQAVASRTYAAYERGHTSNADYDLCDTAACQAYGGASAETDKTDEAVAQTAKRILSYQGSTAFAQYSASNGGYTVDGGKPYLPAQADPYEGTSPDYYGWTVTVSAKQIENAYNLDNLTDLQIQFRDGRGPRGGRVTAVLLRNDDTGWEGTVSGDSFRRNLGLRSTLFTITEVQ